MRIHLTERQNQVYEYLRTFIRENQKPPTYQEIAKDLALASTNAVYKLVCALEEKGYITRTPRVARGISLARSDDPFVLTETPPILPFAGNATSAHPERLHSRLRGAMITDPRLLGSAKAEECMVVVSGDDGMHGIGIRKGDFLVVEETTWQRLLNGELIAALVGEQLVARWFDFAQSRFHLKASDRTYRDESYAIDSTECHVVGRVLGVMRKL
ncbi:MAG: S24 family peptidase, partial [Rubricoccaceae bacterium]|nr:S24 family peptidase [Rubricoccaceae bacterium]